MYYKGMTVARFRVIVCYVLLDNKIMNNKDNKTQKDTLKIRQFEWYQVETKVRELMGELLQPYTLKLTEDTTKINQLKRAQTNILKRLEDHEFLLDRPSPQKPTYIQQQDDQIANLAHTLTQNHIETESRLKRMEAVMAVYEQKISQLNQLQRRVDKQVLQRGQQFRRYKQAIDKQAAQMMKRQDTQLEEISQLKNNTKSAVSKMETRMIGFDNRLKELEDEHRHRSSDIKKIIEDTVSANEKMVKLDLKVADLLVRVQDRERDSKLSQKFMSKVKQVKGQLKFLSNFLQQYEPLYIQMQIAQTLNSFVQGKQRRKLCIYEEQTFARLHQHILKSEKWTLSDMMSTYSEGIRKVISRNKKYVINLAISESIRLGSNLYEFREFRLEDLVQSEEEQNNKKAAAAVDPQEIAKVVTQQLSAVRSEFKQMMSAQLAPTRSWMSELQEQMVFKSVQYDNKYQSVKKSIYQMSTRQELEEKQTKVELDMLTARHQQFNNFVTQFKEYVRDILNFSSVINHIVIQDEIDRQGTALYALKAETGENAPPPTIHLDPNCLNCDPKTSSNVQKAFKMACLAYNPSQIAIDDQMFSREQILEVSTSILQKLKKRLLGSEINKPIHEQIKRSPIGYSSKQTKDNKKRSVSTIKDMGNQTARGKELQTLLPTLGAAKQRQRRSQLSVFY